MLKHGCKKFLNASLIGMSMCLVGCKEQPQQQMPVIPVVSCEVATETVPLYVTAVGRCVASESVRVVPQVDGAVESVHVQQGQQVHKGDLLFKINADSYLAALQIAEAQVESVSAKLKIDEAQLERSKTLVPSNYISQQQYESYEAQVEQDKAQLKLAEGQLRTAQINLEDCTITAPVDGRVGKYLLDVGNVVREFQDSSALVTIENVDSLFVDFSVSENHYADVQKYFALNNGSLKFEVSPLSDPNIKSVGTLQFIDNKISTSTGALNLRGVLENTGHHFWPGQSVRVKLLLHELKEAVVVPAETIKMSQQGRYAFVIKEDKSVEMRQVEVGQVHDDKIVVYKGLKAGETVVQIGQLMLVPGMHVVEVPDQRAGYYDHESERIQKIAEKNPTK